jgi:excisionase family DNA binding protein
MSRAVRREVGHLLKRGVEHEPLFDPQSLANYLRVEKGWIYKQVQRRAIPFFKAGRYLRFRKSAIDRWIDEETVKPAPPLSLMSKRKRAADC